MLAGLEVVLGDVVADSVAVWVAGGRFPVVYMPAQGVVDLKDVAAHLDCY